MQPDCILATNTSSISITELAQPLKHPGRLVGMHFFNPAPRMPLVIRENYTHVLRDWLKQGDIDAAILLLER